MKAIIAVNKKGWIGKDNRLPWKSSEDLAHFKKITEGKVLLCGYNTYQTLPNVVKNRTKVICDDRDMNPQDLIDKHSGEDIWCIGGKKTYEKYASYFTELHISIINDLSRGDCSFPSISIRKDCRVFHYYFNSN